MRKNRRILKLTISIAVMAAMFFESSIPAFAAAMAVVGGNDTNTAEEQPADSKPAASSPAASAPAAPGEPVSEEQGVFAAPAGLYWQEQTARWSKVSGAESYTIYIYKDGTRQGAFTISDISDTSYPLSGFMAASGEGVYAFSVIANKGSVRIASSQSPEYLYTSAPQTEGPLDFTKKTENDSGEGWSWDAKTKTLTLTGANISAEKGDAVVLPANSKVVIDGNSSIEAQEGAAIRSEGDITVQNKPGATAVGALVVYGEEGGVHTTGALVINSGTLSASGKGDGANGVEAKSVDVKGGTLKAFGGASANSVKSDGAFTLAANASFYGATADGNGGISANGKDTAEYKASTVFFDSDTETKNGNTSALGEAVANQGEQTVQTVNLPMKTLARAAAASAPKANETYEIRIELPAGVQKKYFGQDTPAFLSNATVTKPNNLTLSDGDLVYDGNDTDAVGRHNFNFKASGIKVMNGGEDVTDRCIVTIVPNYFTIEEYKPSETARVGGARLSDSGWWIANSDGDTYTDDSITLFAPDGFLISQSQNFTGAGSSVRIATQEPGYSDRVAYYLKAVGGDNDGAVSARKELKVDLQSPNTEQPDYEIENDTWLAGLINIITFGLAGNKAFSFTINDITDAGAGIDRLYYKCEDRDGNVKADSNVPVAGDGTASFTIPFSDEYYKITYYATDKAGNRSVPYTMKYDGMEAWWILESQPPTIELDPPANVQGWYIGGQRLSVIVKDAQSGIKSIECDITDGVRSSHESFSGASEDNKRTEWKSSAIIANDYSNGRASISVTAEDNSGNISTQVFNFQVDANAPVIDQSSITQDPASPPGVGWIKGPVTVRFNAADAESGIASVEVKCGDETIRGVTNSGSMYTFTAQKSGTYKITVTDRAGNQTTRDYTIEGQMDGRAPGAPTVTVNGEAINKKWYNSMFPPSISITAPARDVTGSNEKTIYKFWNISSGETQASAEEIEIIGSQTVRLEKEGRYGILAYTEDEVGNRTEVNGEVKWDATPPQIVKVNASDVDADQFGEIFGSSSVGINVIVKDTASGVPVLQYWLDDDKPDEPRKAYPKGQVDSEGNHTFSISIPKNYKGSVRMSCTDNAENKSADVTGGATIEDRAPTVTVQMPKTAAQPNARGWYTYPLTGKQGENGVIEISVTDMPDNTEAGISKVVYKLGEDGEERELFSSYDRTYSLDLTYRCQSPIKTVLMIKATDRAGNESAWVKQPLQYAEKSPTIPEIQINPPEDVWTKEGAGLTIVAEDEVCDIVEYSFDGGKTWQSSPTYVAKQNQTINMGMIQARNEAGFIGNYLKSVEIKNVDNTPPVISSVTKSTTLATREAVTLTVEASDNGALHEEAYAITSQLSEPKSDWQAENLLQVTENGTYYVWVRDAAGNAVYSEPVRIENIDHTPPVGTFSPEDGSKIATDGETIKVTFDEKVVGRNIVVASGSRAATNVTLATDGRSLTFKTPKGLESASDYQFMISGITDAVGNPYSGTVSFTTVGQLYSPISPVKQAPEALLDEPVLVDPSGSNSGLYLVMQELTTAQERAITSQIEIPEGAVVQFYEIHMATAAGKKSNPTGKVNVVLTYPDGTETGHEFTLYHFKNGATGKPTKVSTTESFAGISFSASTFSPFALIAVPTQYTIEITSGTGGATIPAGRITVQRNGEQAVAVTPQTGYKISRVIVDGKTVQLTNDEYIFKNVTSNHAMEVQFESTAASQQPNDPNNPNGGNTNNGNNGNSGNNTLNPSPSPNNGSGANGSGSSGNGSGGNGSGSGSGGSGSGSGSSGSNVRNTGSDEPTASNNAEKVDVRPKTGDTSTPIWILVAVMVAAAAIVVVAIIMRKRKNK